tara:strand:- start:852 stop:1079 length:228 start_codon:yes stop_codon:yes gene_type:complete
MTFILLSCWLFRLFEELGQNLFPPRGGIGIYVWPPPSFRGKLQNVQLRLPHNQNKKARSDSSSEIKVKLPTDKTV